ncbi:hypothetical protein AB1285_02875 [Microbacterium sp. NRRL B-14842]|uniref:hypothetical protein n=1 Tax=Microbacterium sp. NRRL B-14842 TaxID=3162881 RepID=UPI003D2A7D87
MRGPARGADPHGERGEREDLRHDRDGARVAEGLLALGETERVDGAQQEGAQRPDTPADAGDEVVQLGCVPGILAPRVAGDRGGEDVVPEPVRDPEGAQREADRHPRGLRDREQVGRDLSADRSGASRETHGEGGEQRERSQQDPEVQEDPGAEDVGRDHARERGDERTGAARL